MPRSSHLEWEPQSVRVGLLVALRVVGKGRGERGGTEHERSGGGEDYGSVAKHGEFSFALVKRGDHGM